MPPIQASVTTRGDAWAYQGPDGGDHVYKQVSSEPLTLGAPTDELQLKLTYVPGTRAKVTAEHRDGVVEQFERINPNGQVSVAAHADRPIGSATA